MYCIVIGVLTTPWAYQFSACPVLIIIIIMEYSSTIWDPHTSVNINRVESIQRYAARMYFRNYSRYSSVTSMLAELNLPTLEERRIRAKLQLFYKIICHLVTIPDNCLIPIPPSLRSGYFK